MIWSRGELLPDDGLTISVTDRTFEHGLGLFETLRTWNGRAPLLEAHRDRMLRSSGELGLPIAPADFPDNEAVTALLQAEGAGGDRMLRITATGGSDSGRSVVWMRSSPLPPPTPEGGASLLVGAWKVAPDDGLARHKTLNYWSRRMASEMARSRGFDEAAIGTSEDVIGDFFYEGSRSNLFVVVDRGIGVGRVRMNRPMILTASLDGPIVPGIMRGLVLEIAREQSMKAEEVVGIDMTWLERIVEVFLTNSVRGIMPVGRAALAEVGVEWTWPAPGPWTRRLQAALVERLGYGGNLP